MIRHLDIADGAFIGQAQSVISRLNLPQIGSMKQIKLAKDITTIGSGSPNGSINARKLRRADGPRNKGSIEVGGMGIVGSSVKGKNQSMDMYGIGETVDNSDYSSEDNIEDNNISRIADASMISDITMLKNLTNQNILLP